MHCKGCTAVRGLPTFWHWSHSWILRFFKSVSVRNNDTYPFVNIYWHAIPEESLEEGTSRLLHASMISHWRGMELGEQSSHLLFWFGSLPCGKKEFSTYIKINTRIVITRTTFNYLLIHLSTFQIYYNFKEATDYWIWRDTSKGFAVEAYFLRFWFAAVSLVWPHREKSINLLMFIFHICKRQLYIIPGVFRAGLNIAMVSYRWLN